MSQQMTACAKCALWFSFVPGRGRARKYCDRCSKSSTQKRYRENHPERAAAAQAAWRSSNTEAARRLSKDWRLRNTEGIAIRDAERRLNNREQMQEWHRQWSRRNRSQISARVVQWQKDNPDKVYARSLRRRARLMGAEINDFTSADWADLLAEHGESCYYCGAAGVALEREHKIPLSRGGNHTKSNIVPACGPCNRLKGTKTDAEFVT